MYECVYVLHTHKHTHTHTHTHIYIHIYVYTLVFLCSVWHLCIIIKCKQLCDVMTWKTPMFSSVQSVKINSNRKTATVRCAVSRCTLPEAEYNKSSISREKTQGWWKSWQMDDRTMISTVSHYYSCFSFQTRGLCDVTPILHRHQKAMIKVRKTWFLFLFCYKMITLSACVRSRHPNTWVRSFPVPVFSNGKGSSLLAFLFVIFWFSRRPYGVLANVLDYNFVINDFELQFLYYVTFGLIPSEKAWTPLYP